MMPANTFGFTGADVDFPMKGLCSECITYAYLGSSCSGVEFVLTSFLLLRTICLQLADKRTGHQSINSSRFI